MKQFKQKKHRFDSKVEWPEAQRKPIPSIGNLFEDRVQYRKIIISIDETILTSEDKEVTLPSILSGLLTHPYVILYAIQDPGESSPNKEEAQATVRDSTDRARAVVYQEGDLLHLAYRENSMVKSSFMRGNHTAVAENDTETEAYSDLHPEEAKKRRVTDTKALKAALSLRSDIYITEREYPFYRTNMSSGVTVARPSEAISLVGLYLRAQGEYIIYRSPKSGSTIATNKNSYYFAGASQSLPRTQGWLSNFPQDGSDTEEKIKELCYSVVYRIHRAIEARDRVLVLKNKIQTSEVQISTISELDILLQSLMSAVDITARIAHWAYDIDISIRQAGWQKSNSWLPKIRESSPELAALFDPSKEHKASLTILANMRNSIHAEVLQSVTYVRQWSSENQTLVSIPQEMHEQVIQAMKQSGGELAWGVTLPKLNDLIDPGIFTEKILKSTVSLLNDVIFHLSKCDFFQHHTPTGVQILSSEEEVQLEHDRKQGLSIRWQLGLHEIFP